MFLTNLGCDNPLWISTLQKLRHDVYHLPKYCQLEATRQHISPHAFLLVDGDKILFVPYLLRKCTDVYHGMGNEVFDIVSPYGYPGILLSEEAAASTEFIESALGEIKKEMIKQKICSAFFRLHPILNHQFNTICEFAKVIKQGETVSIDLTLSEDKLWSTTRRGHQSTINKCKRLGVTVDIFPFDSHIHDFVEIYEETMNRVKAVASYYFDDDYFNNLVDLGEHVHLGVAYVDGHLASTCIFFECCGIVQAHLCGTKSEFLSYSPLMLILDYARRWYKQRGNEFLHLGSGYQGSTGDAIFNFKTGFSKQRFDLSALCLIGDEKQYHSLVESRARTLNVRADDLLNTQFFPSYRSSSLASTTRQGSN
jgi:Acetyltransferase (GNAT) domain